MILVLVETDAQGAIEVSRETLTFARGLADKQGDTPVHALLVGPAGGSVAAQLGEYGVAEVHHAEGEVFDSYAAAAWATAMTEAVSSSGAAVVTAAGTPRGNEVLAHVATRLGVAMAANVVAVDDVHPLTVSRQVLGGAALEEMRLDGDVAVFSVAGHACEPTPVDAPTTPAVRQWAPAVSAEDVRARVVRTEQGEPDESGALKSARAARTGSRRWSSSPTCSAVPSGCPAS
jgi:electron transfer flavoprotein alpha subunit